MEESIIEEKAPKISLFRKKTVKSMKIKEKDNIINIKCNELKTQTMKNSKLPTKNMKDKECNLSKDVTKNSENENDKSSTKVADNTNSKTLKNKSLLAIKKDKSYVSSTLGRNKLEKETSKSSVKKEENIEPETIKRSKSFFRFKRAGESSGSVVGAKKSEKDNKKQSNVKTDTLSKGSNKTTKLENTKTTRLEKHNKEVRHSAPEMGSSNSVSAKNSKPQIVNNGGRPTKSNATQIASSKLTKENTTTKPSLKSENSTSKLTKENTTPKPSLKTENNSKVQPQKVNQEPSVKTPKQTVKPKLEKQTLVDPVKSGKKLDTQKTASTNVNVKKPDIPKKPSLSSTPRTPRTGERCGSRRPSDMVTMSSEKAAARRKTDSNNGAAGSGAPAAAASNNEDSPNQLVYKKMEQIVEKMQDEGTGVPVKTVKSFMSKIPSVFTGSDLIMWMMKNLDVEDQAEALHLAHLMAAHGYFFPIDDHMLTVKNDNTFYRFQTPYFWPSNCWEPENTDYAVYLCKRTMQNKTRLELADYEAENLARLQKMFSRKWEFIFMQAEAQSKVDKKRDKLERKVLDSQERAFWDVHRPMPGCVNTTEVDIKKACRVNKPLKSSRHLQLGVAGGRISPSTSETDLASPTEAVKRHIAMLKQRLDRRNIKVSKVAEACIGYFEQYAEYDPFFTPPELPNPWVSDSPEFWEQEKMAKDISARRVKRWAFSLQELLQDPVGREHFIKFLDKEFSGENLKFWESVQQLKALPQKDVQDKVDEIWLEFLAPDASCPLNVDSQSYETTKKNMENLDRWSFDVAAAHVYHLMKSDSYSRYLRSEMYKEFLNGSKKKTSVKGIRSIVSFSARKESALS